MDDAQSSVNQAFYDMAIQLVEASVSAWPAEPLLQIALVQLKKQEPAFVLKEFDAHFGKYVSRLSNKDSKALEEASTDALLEGLDLFAKYSSASEATQATLWTYIGHLCRFASMEKLYKHIPKNVIGAVTEAANQLKTGLDNGTLDPATINPMDLGKQVMEKFKPEDIDAMMKQMMNNPEAMSAVMSQMGSIMGQNGPGVDVSSMLAMLGPK
jgi:hypothetical protein